MNNILTFLYGRVMTHLYTVALPHPRNFAQIDLDTRREKKRVARPWGNPSGCWPGPSAAGAIEPGSVQLALNRDVARVAGEGVGYGR